MPNLEFHLWRRHRCFALLEIQLRLRQLIWIVLLAGGLSACEDNEVRGIFVAKFFDGSAHFVKRIRISTVDGPELHLALTSKTRHCEFVAPVPAGALSGIGDCKDITGIASLRCDEQKDLPILWQMTSCHSGYGRSLEGAEPVFLFGFSGSAYSAQNQLEQAMVARLIAPTSVCPMGEQPTSQNDCDENGIPALPLLLKLTSLVTFQ